MFKKDVKKIFLEGGEGYKFLFIAAFLAQASFIPNSIFLYTLKRPLPVFLSYSFSLICLVLFLISLSFYFKKSFSGNEKGLRNTIVNNIICSVINIILVLLVMLVYAILSQQFIRVLPYFSEKNITSLIILLIFIVSAIVVQIIILSVLTLFTVSFQYGLRISALGKVYCCILTTFVRKFFRVLFYSLLAVGILLLINIIQNLSENILSILMPDGFFKNFIFYVIGAFTNGYFMFILINMCITIMNDMEDKIKVKIESSKPKSLPVFPIIVLALFVVLAIIIIPPNRNSIDTFITDIKLQQDKGDALGKIGYSQQSIYEYDDAYSKLISLKSYLQGIKGWKVNNKALQDEAIKNFDTALSLNGQNPYIPYFKGNLYLLSNNPDSAIQQYNTLLYNKKAIYEGYFGKLKAYKIKNQKDNIGETLNILVSKELYFDRFNNIENLSVKKLEKYIDELNDLEKNLGPKMVYKAVEKAKYLDFQTAEKELMELKKLYPNDTVISYELAKLENQYRSEQSRYGLVKDNAESFDSQLNKSLNKSDEVNKKLFVAQMYLNTNDVEAAEKVLGEIYSKFPGDIDVIEQYSSVLTKNKKYDDALKVTEAALIKNKENYYLYYINAMCYLNKKDYSRSLENIELFEQITLKDSKLTKKLDECTYAYALAFSYVIGEKNALEEVEKHKSNIVLYNYIYATKAWREKDAAASKESISKVLAANNQLGYAYYVMGVNCYEETVRKNLVDFSDAEKYYLQSLEMLPDHAEGYFALAHCYKKWGKNKEALRAFRKVVDLMPCEDHRTDPYGMTVHALGEINNLSQYDVKEGN